MKELFKELDLTIDNTIDLTDAVYISDKSGNMYVGWGISCDELIFYIRSPKHYSFGKNAVVWKIDWVSILCMSWVGGKCFSSEIFSSVRKGELFKRIVNKVLDVPSSKVLYI